MKLLYKFCFTVITIFVIAACDNNYKVSNNKPINLLMDSVKSDGLGADVQLSIDKIQTLDTAIIYTAQAVYKNRLVGFEVSIPKKTNSRKDGFGEGITIKTTGKNSNDFRNALAEIYKLKIDTNKKFINEIIVSYVDLGQFTKGLGEKDVKDEAEYYKQLKLFFLSPEGEEAEVFLNIDKQQKTIEFMEKDQEYRSLIIGFLTHKE